MIPFIALGVAGAAGLIFFAGKQARGFILLTEEEIEQVKLASKMVLDQSQSGEDVWIRPIDALTFWVQSRANLPKVDPLLVRAHIMQESSFRPHVLRFELNKDGKPWSVSLGLTQILYPRTTDGLADLAGFQKDDVHRMFSPHTNLKAGIILMAQLQKRFPDIADRVSAYNAGPNIRDAEGNKKTKRGTPYFNEDYVRKVMKNYRDRGGKEASLEVRFN